MPAIPDATIELTIVTDPKKTPSFNVWWGDPLIAKCTLPEGMTFEGISEVLCQIKHGGVMGETAEALVWASVVPDQESSEAIFVFTADAMAQLPMTRREGQFWMVVKLVREDTARGSLTFYGGNLTAVRHNFSGQPITQPIPGSSQFATRTDLTTEATARAEADDALEAALAGKASASHTHTKADVGLGNVDNTSDANKPVSTAQATALAGKAAASHTHTKADVGLGNVDNTSDANKPVSTAQAAALAAKAPLNFPNFTGGAYLMSNAIATENFVNERTALSQTTPPETWPTGRPGQILVYAPEQVHRLTFPSPYDARTPAMEVALGIAQNGPYMPVSDYGWKLVHTGGTSWHPTPATLESALAAFGASGVAAIMGNIFDVDGGSSIQSYFDAGSVSIGFDIYFSSDCILTLPNGQFRLYAGATLMSAGSYTEIPLWDSGVSYTIGDKVRLSSDPASAFIYEANSTPNPGDSPDVSSQWSGYSAVILTLSEDPDSIPSVEVTSSPYQAEETYWIQPTGNPWKQLQTVS